MMPPPSTLRGLAARHSTLLAGALAALVMCLWPARAQVHSQHADDRDHAEHVDDHGHERTTSEGEAEDHPHAEEIHADEVTLTPEAIEEHGVRTTRVERRVLSTLITAPGRVSYNLEAMAHVGTPVEGRIADVRVRLGDIVQRGDTLLVIESPALAEAQSDFLQRRGQREVTRAARDVAQSAADRARALSASGGISRGELQRREGELRQAEGALIAAQSAVTAAENLLHVYGMDQGAVESLARSGEIDPRFDVTAPIGGTVIEREATLGEVVGPEREALLVLADTDVLWVIADVPEMRIGEVAVGAPATVTVAALGASSFDGTVALIAGSIDPNTRAAATRIEVFNDHTAIRPGMFAQVEIVGSAAPRDAPPEAVIAVPDAAIQTVEGSDCVFVTVPGEPNTFAVRRVTLGAPVGRLVPVLAGLEEGEEIVVAGGFILKAELGKEGATHDH